MMAGGDADPQKETFNRTIVELKPKSHARHRRTSTTFNRTIVELKPALYCTPATIPAAFNRTIVELKRAAKRLRSRAHLPLIAPLWN